MEQAETHTTRGRPPLYDEPQRRINTTLPGWVIEYLRDEYGSVAAGVRALVEKDQH